MAASVELRDSLLTPAQFLKDALERGPMRQKYPNWTWKHDMASYQRGVIHALDSPILWTIPQNMWEEPPATPETQLIRTLRQGEGAWTTDPFAEFHLFNRYLRKVSALFLNNRV
jgi:hypothetical protein